MVGLRLQNLQRRQRDGFPHYYTAEVVNGTTALQVTRRYGSWMTSDHRHHLRPEVAAWLQREVGKVERAEGRAP